MRAPGPSQVLAAARVPPRLAAAAVAYRPAAACSQVRGRPADVRSTNAQARPRDNSILWVHSMILSLGSVTLVARLLEGQLNLSAHVVYFAFARLDGAKCRFHTQRLDLSQHLRAHALVDPQCTERDAQLASMQMRLAVAIISAAAFAIADAQFASTVTAAEKAVE